MASSLAVFVVAVGAGLLYLCGFAKSKATAKEMLREYRKLLADARQEKADEREAERKEVGEVVETTTLDPP